MKNAQSSTEKGFETSYSIAPDIIGYKNAFVNYYFIGQPGQGNAWWLVDAGLPGASREIIRNAEKLYGMANPPEGVILTHGHFDHTGALRGLIRKWPELNIYAHPQEMAFITGEASYPPPDPSIRRAMARMSWLYPRESAHIKHPIHPLEGEEIPGLKGWKQIPTPGHSPGHISLFREEDRMLIVGDAFVTTNQNSAYSALTQKKEMHAPPGYLTIQWQDARQSIRTLEDLQPEAAATGHGLPFFGEELRQELRSLLVRFEKEELPADGHYVKHPVNYPDIQHQSFDYPKSYQRAVNIGRAAALTAAGAGAGFILKRLRNRRENGESRHSFMNGYRNGDVKNRFRKTTRNAKNRTEELGNRIMKGTGNAKKRVEDIAETAVEKGSVLGRRLKNRAREITH